MNEAASNYRLKSTSAARDAGDSRLHARDDFDGIPRPQDNQVDVGAFEYSETERPLAPAALEVL
jgi:hypothetical protein